MPRILGVDIPKEKRIEASIKYIYGVGPKRALEILREANIDINRRAKELTEEEVSRLTNIIQNRYVTEGDLRREINQNIKRLMELGTYRGIRHRRGLPVNGQRTKTNSRTRKGRKPTIGQKSKKR